MTHILKPTIFTAIIAATLSLMSCSDKKSYADLLNDEHHAVNYFLAQQKVENEIPADTVFKTGPDAPYYRLDEEGNLYMQVLQAGNRDDMAQDNDQIYFRYTRYNLTQYMETGQMVGDGNSLNMSIPSTSFRFNNFTLSSSSAYGSGIQMPLHYLGVDCEVNIVIKSQYGLSSEIASVVPFMYNLRYFRSPL